MKKSSSMKWLLNVIGKQKFNIIFLTVIQTVLGISSVIFAFILRNIVDSLMLQLVLLLEPRV